MVLAERDETWRSHRVDVRSCQPSTRRPFWLRSAAWLLRAATNFHLYPTHQHIIITHIHSQTHASLVIWSYIGLGQVPEGKPLETRKQTCTPDMRQFLEVFDVRGPWAFQLKTGFHLLMSWGTFIPIEIFCFFLFSSYKPVRDRQTEGWARRITWPIGRPHNFLFIYFHWQNLSPWTDNNDSN